MGGVFKSPNLSLYAYSHQNPVNLTDADGREVGIEGQDSADVDKFVEQAYKITGIKVEPAGGGLYKQVGERDASVGNAIAASKFREVLTSNKKITVIAVHDDPDVDFDHFRSDKVDVADMEALFGKSNTDGVKSNTLAAAIFAHFMEERLIDAEKGGGPKADLSRDEYATRFDPLHKRGLEMESKVMGAVAPREEGRNGFLGWRFRYKYSNGRIEQFNFTFAPDTRTWR